MCNWDNSSAAAGQGSDLRCAQNVHHSITDLFSPRFWSDSIFARPFSVYKRAFPPFDDINEFSGLDFSGQYLRCHILLLDMSCLEQLKSSETQAVSQKSDSGFLSLMTGG